MRQIKTDSVRRARTAEAALRLLAKTYDLDVEPTCGSGGIVARYSVEVSFGISVSLEVGLSYVSADENPKGVPGWKIRASVNCPSMLKRPIQARALAVILSETADLACLIETAADDTIWPVAP